VEARLVGRGDCQGRSKDSTAEIMTSSPTGSTASSFLSAQTAEYEDTSGDAIITKRAP
jgi:hypothetical protein